MGEVPQGGDHWVQERDGLVVRRRRDDSAEAEVPSVVQEARLLSIVAALSPVAVPQVTCVIPELQQMSYPKLPGRPLLEVVEALPARAARGIGGVLGGLLSVLHGVPARVVSDLVPRDEVTPAQWLEEAAGWYGAVRAHLSTPRAAAVARFLDDAPPRPCGDLVFSHNDLGAEHVLVDDSWTVTGVIDWTDAAITDPAYDFGLLLRDLGPAAFESAVAEYRRDPSEGLVERAWFYARATLLEDLAFGIREHRHPYERNSRRVLPLLFGR